MNLITWKSKHILTEHGFVDGYLTICGDRIRQISSQPPGPFEDLGSLGIFPGIIDVHNHGFGGWSMTDPCRAEEVKGYQRALASVGVTGILPTAKSEAFEAIAQVMEEEDGNPRPEGARVYGIHSEGPFWARGGEHTIGEVWPLPSVEEAKRLTALARGHMKVMAIAPELPGAYEVIRYLHSQKIKVACCHTDAHAREIFQAAQYAGFDIATHLGNGMRGIHHRDVGALGALLLMDGLYYEIITDLNHICPEMLQLMFRIQPYSRFCLISDSNYIAGLPSGTYLRYGRENYADEKGLILNSDGRICGSGSWVLRNLRQLITQVGVPEADACSMASINPARYLGIEDQTGSIRSGKQADLIFLDANYECQRTYVGGRLVFDRRQNQPEDFFNPEAMKRKIK